MIFRRNPSHFTITKLPWELHEVYNELEASGISTLHSPDKYNPSFSSTYINDYGSPNNNESPTPIAAYGSLVHHKPNNNNHNNISTNNNHNHNKHLPQKSTTHNNNSTQHRHRISIHHTRDGRRFLSESNTSNRANCSLCFNKHPNPWHDTDHCPFKHTTHIIDKDVRERVMQHNALYGAENRQFK
jgi:hypothetical protein